MSTAARLETTMSGGIGGVKKAMQQMQATAKAKNEEADKTNEEIAQVKKRHARMYAQQMHLRDKIVEREEDIRKTQQKLKDIVKREDEKAMFLQESKKFGDSLKKSTPEEGRVKEVEERLKCYKDIYSKNYMRHQKAREKKSDLEQKVEFAENRAQDAKRRLDALTTNLEYNQREEQRRSEGCREAIDMAHRSEKTCIDIERGMEAVMRRKEGALQRIEKLEKQVARYESNIETLNFDRRRMEATIKELLLNVRNQKIN